MALKRLQDEFELTQQEVADAVGKSRVTVTNLMRLIGLHIDVRRMLEHGDLEMGHARALLGCPMNSNQCCAGGLRQGAFSASNGSFGQAADFRVRRGQEQAYI